MATVGAGECLGVGLVRTFDAAAGLLYVLSPVPLSTLSRVNLLQVRIWPLRWLLWLLRQGLDATVLRDSCGSQA